MSGSLKALLCYFSASLFGWLAFHRPRAPAKTYGKVPDEKIEGGEL